MEPCWIFHSLSLRKYRRLSSCVQATDCGSKSNECTLAPIRCAAKLCRPDPEPISKKVFPFKSVLPKNDPSAFWASKICSSDSTRKKFFQFSPNGNPCNVALDM